LLISPDGGEAWPLTKSETNVEDFHWAKPGRSILFTAAERPSKASKARKERFSAYEVIEKDYEQNQLWWVDAEAALKVTAPQSAKQLTIDPALNINSFAISPGAATATKIVALPGPDRSPMFSPDGKQLAFTTSLGQPNFFYANTTSRGLTWRLCWQSRQPPPPKFAI
jgi:WD40-like Beta Propeller Repeat